MQSVPDKVERRKKEGRKPRVRKQERISSKQRALHTKRSTRKVGGHSLGNFFLCLSVVSTRRKNEFRNTDKARRTALLNVRKREPLDGRRKCAGRRRRTRILALSAESFSKTLLGLGLSVQGDLKGDCDEKRFDEFLERRRGVLIKEKKIPWKTKRR